MVSAPDISRRYVRLFDRILQRCLGVSQQLLRRSHSTGPCAPPRPLGTWFRYEQLSLSPLRIPLWGIIEMAITMSTRAHFRGAVNLPFEFDRSSSYRSNT